MTKREILANLKRIHTQLDIRETDSAIMVELRAIIHHIQRDVVGRLPPNQARAAREMYGYND